MRMWIGFIRLRTGTKVSSCEHGDELFGATEDSFFDCLCFSSSRRAVLVEDTG